MIKKGLTIYDTCHIDSYMTGVVKGFNEESVLNQMSEGRIWRGMS